MRSLRKPVAHEEETLSEKDFLIRLKALEQQRLAYRYAILDFYSIFFSCLAVPKLTTVFLSQIGGVNPVVLSSRLLPVGREMALDQYPEYIDSLAYDHSQAVELFAKILQALGSKEMMSEDEARGYLGRLLTIIAWYVDNPEVNDFMGSQGFSGLQKMPLAGMALLVKKHKEAFFAYETPVGVQNIRLEKMARLISADLADYTLAVSSSIVGMMVKPIVNQVVRAVSRCFLNDYYDYGHPQIIQGRILKKMANKIFNDYESFNERLKLVSKFHTIAKFLILFTTVYFSIFGAEVRSDAIMGSVFAFFMGIFNVLKIGRSQFRQCKLQMMLNKKKQIIADIIQDLGAYEASHQRDMVENDSLVLNIHDYRHSNAFLSKRVVLQLIKNELLLEGIPSQGREILLIKLSDLTIKENSKARQIHARIKESLERLASSQRLESQLQKIMLALNDQSSFIKIPFRDKKKLPQKKYFLSILSPVLDELERNDSLRESLEEGFKKVFPHCEITLFDDSLTLAGYQPAEDKALSDFVSRLHHIKVDMAKSSSISSSSSSSSSSQQQLDEFLISKKPKRKRMASSLLPQLVKEEKTPVIKWSWRQGRSMRAASYDPLQVSPPKIENTHVVFYRSGLYILCGKWLSKEVREEVQRRRPAGNRGNGIRFFDSSRQRLEDGVEIIGDVKVRASETRALFFAVPSKTKETLLVVLEGKKVKHT